MWFLELEDGFLLFWFWFMEGVRAWGEQRNWYGDLGTERHPADCESEKKKPNTVESQFKSVEANQRGQLHTDQKGLIELQFRCSYNIGRVFHIINM